MHAIKPQDPATTLASALDALPIVAFLARPDGTISYVSRAWADFTGLDPAQALENRFPALIHPDQRGRAVEKWLAANLARTPYRDEIALLFGDGTYRWVLCQAQPVHNSAVDGIIGWFGTVTDVDDRKRTEETFREQAEFNARLIDSSDDCIKILDLEAHLVSMSVNGQKALGITDIDALIGTSWFDLWQTQDRAAAVAAIEAARAGGTGRFIGYFPVADEPRWFDVVVTAILGANGRPDKLLAVSRDITIGRLADKAREMFVALVENSGDFIGIGDTDGSVVYVNEAGRQLLEIESLEVAKATPLIEYFCPADRDYVRTDVLPALQRTGRWLGDFQFRNFRTGAPVPVAYNVFQLVDRNGSAMGIATVSRDRRRRLRIEAGLRLLSRTGVAALHSLNSIVTLPTIAQAFVPEYASYSIIDVVDAGERWQRTVVHRDRSKEHIIQNLSKPSESHPVAQAINAGHSTLMIVDGRAAESLWQADRVDAIEALDVRSFITVPVILPNGEIAGGLTAARDAAHPSGNYTPDDIAFVEEAGRRAGAAIANVRLYERERRIAVELQAASLPTSLPCVEHLLLDADYRPGSDEATIGGDWYDAFVLRDGRVAITVGDVIGHGLRAAVTMTKVRQAMQAAALVTPDPNVMLRVADETLRLIDGDGYATAVAALYDSHARTLTFASAGHPGPIVRTPDGRVTDHSVSGLMLGLRTGDETDVVSVSVPPQSTIVLYTDGLVEATRDFDASSARLHAAIARDDVIGQRSPARAIVDFVLGTATAFDDIAVLVAHTV